MTCHTIELAIDNQIADAEDFDNFCDWYYDIVNNPNPWHHIYCTINNMWAWHDEKNEYNAYHYGEGDN